VVWRADRDRGHRRGEAVRSLLTPHHIHAVGMCFILERLLLVVLRECADESCCPCGSAGLRVGGDAHGACVLCRQHAPY
jgi:hypothetical protein